MFPSPWPCVPPLQLLPLPDVDTANHAASGGDTGDAICSDSDASDASDADDFKAAMMEVNLATAN
jgi:hypothetical protein